MTTTDATNGREASEPTEPKGAASARTKRQPVKAGGLIKAREEEPAVIVLADNVRLIPTDYLPNHRPITASDFEVVATLDSSGRRPIMADTFEISSLDTLPGHRPISVSTLPISDLHTLPGNRPIAPNDVVDPPASVLMGYLD